MKKTQISFKKRYIFASVSFLPVRSKQERGSSYITLTFSLEQPLDSLRIDQKVQPYPQRWTHHILLQDRLQIDDEWIGWLKEAAIFAEMK